MVRFGRGVREGKRLIGRMMMWIEAVLGKVVELFEIWERCLWSAVIEVLGWVKGL